MSKGPRRQQRRILEKLCRQALSSVEGSRLGFEQTENHFVRSVNQQVARAVKMPLVATVSLIVALMLPLR